MNKGFVVLKGFGVSGGYDYDSKTVFFKEGTGKVEAEYFYKDGMVNYIISWGFNSGSLGEMRKQKSMKIKKPFFSFKNGWFN